MINNLSESEQSDPGADVPHSAPAEIVADQSQSEAAQEVRHASREEIDQASYWEQVYVESGDEAPGWDLGGPNPELLWQLANASPSIKPGRIIVPGCGFGHDVGLLAALGFEVVGVDMAPTAAATARWLLDQAGLKGEIVESDFFELGGDLEGSFDYLYEYTCFCAIHPSRRREYAEHAARLLKPGGQLIGCFYHHQKDGGPPFDTTPEAVREAFGGLFDMRTLVIAQHSVERREGKELWARFERLG